ncbi:MAG: hypothetical protein COV60_01825 [Candidatus Magasanikbacteria bacterium CG11_big_fil_rev_8_21_14_0_20_43_7]|uniref:Uncharacterized protein n=1 Tax=Candidatus Magasanikbacteria bacterium CG11_big_fil_rev_8_21_14_0_20_43_7 TaxID=1974654 RepID=A0A2H0N4X8_9BACT|nr:MAG: hypothetical protein COV60_01825 [Candidatus Magasanikbacteria bacterium CG11_big_fil_rev_8_21_14_0_20_43_7]
MAVYAILVSLGFFWLADGHVVVGVSTHEVLARCIVASFLVAIIISLFVEIVSVWKQEGEDADD